MSGIIGTSNSRSRIVGRSAVGNSSQTWQTFASSDRTYQTNYTNSTSSPIFIMISMLAVVGGATVNWLLIDGVERVHVQDTDYRPLAVVSAIIPAGSTYQWKYQSVAPTIRNWSELR